MNKRSRPRRLLSVFHNNDSDTWVNDTNEQLSIMPGTQAYKAYVEQRKSEQDGQDLKDKVDGNADARQQEKERKNKEEELNDAYSVANRKFRRRMSKSVQDKEIQRIVDNGLGKHVSIFGNIWAKLGFGGKSNQDELYDDGISADEYKKAVISDYKSDLKEAMTELPDVDHDHDGDIDEDDIVLTPGMRAMSKYM